MAYMLEIGIVCEEPGCKSRAVASVFGTRNDSYGRFCRKHARAKIARLNAIEERDFKAAQRVASSPGAGNKGEGGDRG